MVTTLYRLYDSRLPDETRYYGITSSTIDLRLYEHNRLARIGKKRMPVLDWIRKLQKDNVQPCIEVIAVFETREQAKQAEIEHIELGRQLGYKLLNLAKGGDGGRQPEEVLARIRETKKQQAGANPKYYQDLAEAGRLKMIELRSSSPTWEQERIKAIKDGIIPGQRSEAQKKRMSEKPILREKLSNLYKDKPRIGFGRRRPVRSSEGLDFNSVKEAATHYKATPQEVSSALSNSDAIFASDMYIYFSYLNPEHEQEKNKKRQISSSDGLIFPTITEAARHYQADWVTIQRAIKQNKSYKGIFFTLDFV